VVPNSTRPAKQSLSELEAGPSLFLTPRSASLQPASPLLLKKMLVWAAQQRPGADAWERTPGSGLDLSCYA
jgi:hypothetical protein